MDIQGFVMVPALLDKIEGQHGVLQEEILQVFMNDPHIEHGEKGKVEGEDVYVAYGQTDAGRYVIVFFIYKRDRRALPISARDMERKERRHYAKHPG
jgi:uncharacterized DUF497 family protein